MKTFVVNLPKSIDRKKYMEHLLSPYKKELDVDFIKAVDGRIMSDDEINKQFDTERFFNERGQKVRPGEIGCTLSHQKCYNEIIDRNLPYAIIFEDDLIINEDLKPIIKDLERILDTHVPTLILLSGWFWFTSSKNLGSSHKICKVRDGYLTHSYALNNAAAHLMKDDRPWYVADAWDVFVKRGVNILGITPHICDQDWSGVFKSVVNDECVSKNRMKLIPFLKIKKRAILQHILTLLKMFEKAEK